MTVIETSTHFELKFDFRPSIVSEVKAIGSGKARWNPAKKHWELPLDKKEQIHKLAKKVGASVNQHGGQEVTGIVPPLPDLEVELDLKRALFPFQAKGVAYAIKHKRVIVGDQPGLS